MHQVSIKGRRRFRKKVACEIKSVVPVSDIMVAQRWYWECRNPRKPRMAAVEHRRVKEQLTNL